MWIGADESKRDELIQQVNGQLNALGFKLGRGWMNYDPVIRRLNGRASSYADMAAWAARQRDGGRSAAQALLDWATDDSTGLLSLPAELQDLAIITHLAEVGRGYHSSLEDQLYPLLSAIVSGAKSWSDYRDYAPSLKSAEDSRMEWTA
jgi:hypothetical protein